MYQLIITVSGEQFDALAAEARKNGYVSTEAYVEYVVRGKAQKLVDSSKLG